MTSVDLLTPEAFADVANLVRRARRVVPDGAIRIQCSGSLVVLTVGILPGEGLSQAGSVTAMRVVPGRSSDEVDAAVSLASVMDRIARAGSGETVLAVPPTIVAAPWAGVAPPRTGWERVGSLSLPEVESVAQQVVSAVADIVGSSAGQAAIDAARRGVWAHPSATDPAIPGGMAFTADALGFLRGSAARVARAGRWTRLSTDLGHVLHRGS